MTIKSRLAKLESKAVTNVPPRQTLPAEMWERSINALADALGSTRAETEAALQELTHEQTKQQG